MSFLNDDLVGRIITKITCNEDRKSFSEVCKQWLRVEGLTRSSLSVHIDRPDFSLGDAMTRFPNVTSLVIWGSCTRDSHLELIAQSFPKLETITIYSVDDQDRVDGILGPTGLIGFGEGCANLSRVEFRGSQVVGDCGVAALISSARNIKALVVSHNRWISDEALRAIGCSSSITLLQLMSCSNITDVGLGCLANGTISKNLKDLVLHGCDGISDTGVELLRRMCSLERLELICCSEGITDSGGVAISTIQTLKVLKLVCVKGLSDTTVVSLAENCCSLEVLHLHGCVGITGAGIRAFSGHNCLKHLGLLGIAFSSFTLADVEIVALGCMSLELESVLVDSEWSLDPTWCSELMHEKTRKVIKFVDMYSCFI